MLNSQIFPFQRKRDELGEIGYVPSLPFTLTYGNQSLQVVGLLDTGSSINVLPYQVGLELGASWERQTVAITLTGNLANVEAKGLLLWANVGDFHKVRLAFAWAQTNNVPLLLGRSNFFAVFDVCFYGSQNMFELRLKPN